MAEVITMPKMSDTMEYGIISRWLKQVGDHISEGDILAEVDTDKATMDLESYCKGVLLYVGAKEEEKVKIDQIIAIIGQQGEDIAHLLQGHDVAAHDGGSDPIEHAVVDVRMDVPETFSAHARILASPLAKKIAKERQYDMTQIKGSGHLGRIIQRDVLNFKPDHAGGTRPVQDEYYDERISAMRGSIARVLTESKQNIPHFYLTLQVNMDQALDLRSQLNSMSETRLSVNDLIIKASALALAQYPKLHGMWMGDYIRYHKHAHIGVAVSVQDGILVPVIRRADCKSLVEISKEVKDFRSQAEQGKLPAKACTGATFTISNLGAWGIDHFVAIVNPPASCILAVGAVVEKPVVCDHQVMVAPVLSLTLSCDHRVVDGVLAALFMRSLKDLLEHPLKLLL